MRIFCLKENNSDQDRETFGTVIEALKQTGYTTMSYSDYSQIQKEKYEKGEKVEKGVKE